MNNNLKAFSTPIIFGMIIVIIKIISVDYLMCNQCYQYTNYRSIILIACLINLMIIFFKGLELKGNGFNIVEYSNNFSKIVSVSLIFSAISVGLLGSYLLKLNAHDDRLFNDSNVVIFFTAFFIYILLSVSLYPLRLLIVHIKTRTR